MKCDIETVIYERVREGLRENVYNRKPTHEEIEKWINEKLAKIVGVKLEGAYR